MLAATAETEPPSSVIVSKSATNNALISLDESSIIKSSSNVTTVPVNTTAHERTVLSPCT
jgi:hypothetical protein